MVAAEVWIEREGPPSASRGPLALALGVGVLLGIALTGLAVPRFSLAPSEARVVREYPHPALDREWRGYRTPVDVDRMFRRAR